MPGQDRHEPVTDETYLTGAALAEMINAPPVAQCSRCGRRSWTVDSVGCPCRMPQPDGLVCPGAFRDLR